MHLRSHPRTWLEANTFFLTIFSTVMLLISGSIGTVFYHPPIQQTIAAFAEGFLIVLAAGSVALTIGFKGPDFSQTRRARMVRQEWSLIGLIVCAIVAGAVVAPLVIRSRISIFNGRRNRNLKSCHRRRNQRSHIVGNYHNILQDKLGHSCGVSKESSNLKVLAIEPLFVSWVLNSQI